MRVQARSLSMTHWKMVNQKDSLDHILQTPDSGQGTKDEECLGFGMGNTK